MEDWSYYYFKGGLFGFRSLFFLHLVNIMSILLYSMSLLCSKSFFFLRKCSNLASSVTTNPPPSTLVARGSLLWLCSFDATDAFDAAIFLDTGGADRFCCPRRGLVGDYSEVFDGEGPPGPLDGAGSGPLVFLSISSPYGLPYSLCTCRFRSKLSLLSPFSSFMCPKFFPPAGSFVLYYIWFMKSSFIFKSFSIYCN